MRVPSEPPVSRGSAVFEPVCLAVKVKQLNALFGDENVARLQVAMGDTLAVRSDWSDG